MILGGILSTGTIICSCLNQPPSFTTIITGNGDSLDWLTSKDSVNIMNRIERCQAMPLGRRNKIELAVWFEVTGVTL